MQIPKQKIQKRKPLQKIKIPEAIKNLNKLERRGKTIFKKFTTYPTVYISVPT